MPEKKEQVRGKKGQGEEGRRVIEKINMYECEEGNAFWRFLQKGPLESLGELCTVDM